MESPLAQFKIRPLLPLHLGPYDVSFNNAALYMVVAALGVTMLLTLGVRRGALVPGRTQAAAEMLYEFVANMVRDNVGTNGMRYFPFVFSLFVFILFGNLIGMIPFTFTFTSHIIVTAALALLVFLIVTLIGFARHGLKFFTLFWPSGIPIFLAPLIVPIEIMSYLIRPITLSVRLFGNMMAGHTMLTVFAGFVVMLGASIGLLAGAILPVAMIAALSALELLVAVLQAYVFAILTCIYLHDAIELH